LTQHHQLHHTHLRQPGEASNAREGQGGHAQLLEGGRLHALILERGARRRGNGEQAVAAQQLHQVLRYPAASMWDGARHSESQREQH
jgi:hypothetical protein